MKPNRSLQSITTTCVLAMAWCFQPSALAFDSGSTGAYGAMSISADTTLDLPADGIFHCTTIQVSSGATLRFRRNALNTPVYLLASGDITIDGTIDVSGSANNGRAGGQGGPGGFNGGEGGYGGTGFGGTGQGSSGQGPGGGNPRADFSGTSGCYGGRAYYYGNQYGTPYGNSLLCPLIGGSGGAGRDGADGHGGGGGGGAILIASSTKLSLSGVVRSQGGSPPDCFTQGSGGAIRLVSPLVVGLGSLDTAGGNACGQIGGGGGRARIDCEEGYRARSLHAVGSVSSIGRQMFVFPTIQPRLDIVEVAGQVIPVPAATGVSIVLPQGAALDQIVKIRAINFTNELPITVAVVPSDRPSSEFSATISLQNSPSITSVKITLASDSTNRIFVWTR